MITIFKLGRTTFVLSNRQITPNSPVFIGEVLHREEEEIPPVEIAFPTQMPVTTRQLKSSRVYSGVPGGKRRHLDAAIVRVQKFKDNDPRMEICQGYGRFAHLNVGHTCHSSAMGFLKGNKFPDSNGMVYNLIAWAVTYCGLDVTDTYPMKYTRGKI